MTFDFDEYVNEKYAKQSGKVNETLDFASLCGKVKSIFFAEWERENSAAALEIQIWKHEGFFA